MLPYSGMFAKLLRGCRVEAAPFFLFRRLSRSGFCGFAPYDIDIPVFYGIINQKVK